MDATVMGTVQTPANSTETKVVVRCRTCHLNQFMTRQGNCRRCHRSLRREESLLPIKQQVQLPKSIGSARPTVDMATAIWMLRSVRGLTQCAMAKKMGTTRTYISKLEGNRCMPSAAQIRRIAGTLEVSEYCLIALATVHNQFVARH